MCWQECFGDYYRGCGHYVRSYYSGETRDCGSTTCGLSASHMHRTATNCRCNKNPRDDRRVMNMFQTPCDDCRSAEMARLSRG